MLGTKVLQSRFNTQPPEGGWNKESGARPPVYLVSTHSRLKAAGFDCFLFGFIAEVSTHSRLKAAGTISG